MSWMDYSLFHCNVFLLNSTRRVLLITEKQKRTVSFSLTSSTGFIDTLTFLDPGNNKDVRDIKELW